LDFKIRGRLGRVKSASKGEGISLTGKGGGREGRRKILSPVSSPSPTPTPDPLPSSLRLCKSNMAATITEILAVTCPQENAHIAG